MINFDVTQAELNELDISGLTAPHWFYDSAGAEHYRLLAYFSTFYNGKTLLDIGSYMGLSALALSYNKNNKVISYDIEEFKKEVSADNIEFRLGNIMDNEDLIKSCPFILLDTYHDGDFEKEFIKLLKKIKYKGIVMLDDLSWTFIQEIWIKLRKQKHDLTHIGHSSGTGITIWK